MIGEFATVEEFNASFGKMGDDDANKRLAFAKALWMMSKCLLEECDDGDRQRQGNRDGEREASGWKKYQLEIV